MPKSGPRQIIAIDGPAAAGKGTLARRLAAHFNLPYLDTGLLYRAVGRRVLVMGEQPSDPAAAELAARLLRPADLERSDLRDPEADAAAAAVASVPGVRDALLHFQREFGAENGAVLDGRDIGTVVFPNATVKLFITATAEARANRRWLELRERGLTVGLAEVEREIRVRDARDAARTIAPLKPAEDAVVIDTTALDRDRAFAAALTAAKAKFAIDCSADTMPPP
jgi:CMP/dCMP kinase